MRATVPEAAVDEHHGASGAEYQVGFTGQVGRVEPVTQTFPVQEAAHG